MFFTKGITLESGQFLPEGTDIRVVTELGEVVTGVLLKAAKKEIVLGVEEVRRILSLDELRNISLANVE